MLIKRGKKQNKTTHFNEYSGKRDLDWLITIASRETILAVEESRVLSATKDRHHNDITRDGTQDVKLNRIKLYFHPRKGHTDTQDTWETLTWNALDSSDDSTPAIVAPALLPPNLQESLGNRLPQQGGNMPPPQKPTEEREEGNGGGGGTIHTITRWCIHQEN